MKRWNVIVERPAQKDIAKAYYWIAGRNAEAADRWFEGLYKTMGSLETFPERAALAPESKNLRCEIHEIFHGHRQHKYRILFTISKNQVHVLHVRHGARLALGETETADE
jgi:plasmid stabilization system protein ParE